MVDKELLIKKIDEYGIKKLSLLILLTFQATFTTILGKYSMGGVSNKYIKATVVVWMELFKFLMCAIILLIQSKTIPKFIHMLHRDVISQPILCAKVAVPALLYVIQNNLILIAYNRLNVAAFQVTYQLKILTTALFCVILLRKRIRIEQWIALIILTAGITVVAITTTSKKNSKGFNSLSNPTKDYIIGLIALIVCSITSGFSGVYFEKILKHSGFSVWLLNLQLALFGVPLALGGCLAQNFMEIKNRGFLAGYDYSVWSLAVVQAVGGLVIALVIKHADNILKGFSTSFAIIFSAVLSYFIFGTTLSYCFMLGSLLVIISVLMYSYFS